MLTVEDTEKYPAYPYRCLMRPPEPGAIPKDGLGYVDWKEGYTLGGHHFWGTAVYNRKLTRDEIEQYELEETCFCVCDGG